MGGFSARKICFTINNPEKNVQLEINSEIRFAVWQKEKGSNGTEHYQGYIEFNKAMTMPGIKKYLEEKAHIEKALGTKEQNIEYCSKSETRIDGPWSIGDSSIKQGKRTDLDKVAEEIKTLTLEEIVEENTSTFIRYSKGIKEAYNIIKFKDRTEKPKVIWIYGPTGSGKTKYATSISDDYYIKDGTMWWDGYTQQKVIVVDDFDGHWPFRDLLRFTDRYKYQGQYKGGYVKINSEYIVFTCDRHPANKLHDKEPHELSQFLRRIDEIIFLDATATGYEVPGNTNASLPGLGVSDDF